MSFYLKLFLFIVFSSTLALFTVKQLVKSTDHLPDTFTVNTPYLERADNKAKPDIPKPDKKDIYTQSAVTQELEKEKKATLSKKLANRQKQRATDESISRVSVQRGSRPDDEYFKDEEDAEEDADDKDENEEELEPLPSERAVAGNSGTSKSNSSGESKSNNKGKITRADSDDDMRKTDPNALNKDNTLAANETQLPEIGATGINRDKVESQQEIVQALDVAYAPPIDSGCNFPDNNVVQVGVDYRKASFAIKGQSLTSIDQLVKLYRKCGGGKMLILQNSEGVEDTKERLIQLRKDEVKYYLLQRRVPQDDMIFSDNS